MYERLILMRELLAPDGSIFLHCDWHKDHHLRCLMDEIFGPDKMRNEIAWCYTGPGSPGMKQFNRMEHTRKALLQIEKKATICIKRKKNISNSFICSISV